MQSLAPKRITNNQLRGRCIGRFKPYNGEVRANIESSTNRVPKNFILRITNFNIFETAWVWNIGEDGFVHPRSVRSSAIENLTSGNLSETSE